MNDFKEKMIKNVEDLTFSHNIETVDVHVFDAENHRMTTIKNISAKIFLSYFEYGECVSQDKEKNIEFLKHIL